MGFILFIPFLVIDMVVADAPDVHGMFMLPVIISLPFKILLFVLVDGWHLWLNRYWKVLVKEAQVDGTETMLGMLREGSANTDDDRPDVGLLLVGLTVSILQATTQIQEPTLAFVPKIVRAVGPNALGADH